MTTQKSPEAQQVAALDPIHNERPERVWIVVSNCDKDGKLRMLLEVNGKTKEIWAMKPSYAEQSAGIISEHHNLTWLLSAQSDELAKLKRQLEVAVEGLKFYADDGNWTTPDNGQKYQNYTRILEDCENNPNSDSQCGGKTARASLAQIERIGSE